MSKNRDPLLLSPNWHVDCSLADELPDDRVVSSRFLFNLPFGAVTLTLFVLFGLKLSADLSLRFEIANSTRRIAESRVEVANIKQMQRDYTVVAAKIEQAHSLARSRLFVYEFTAQLGRTRPEQMVINSIESSGSSIVVRGTLGESSERATLLIGQYVAQLAKDPEIGRHFRKDGINVTAFDRNRATDQQNFEITFLLGANPS